MGGSKRTATARQRSRPKGCAQTAPPGLQNKRHKVADGVRVNEEPEIPTAKAAPSPALGALARSPGEESPLGNQTNIHETMHPHGNTITPPSSLDKLAVTELYKQASEEQRTWENVDLMAIIKHRTKTEVWKRIKMPDFRKASGKQVKVYIKQETNMSWELFELKWPIIKPIVNGQLRVTRGYCVSKFKEVFFLFLELLLKLNMTLLYSRCFFLRFHKPTITTEGNRAVFERLQKRNQLGITATDDATWKEESEGWEEWKSYPNFPETYGPDDLSQGPALAFMAWLIHTFSACVGFWKSSAHTYPGCIYTSGLEYLSVDDFAFIFVQVQHNIGKWILLNKALKEEKLRENVEQKEMTEEEKKFKKIINDRGYEYPFGSGVSGVEGRARYEAMTKFFYEAYYDQRKKNVVDNNRKALVDALMKLIDEDRERDIAENGGVTSVHKERRKKKLENEVSEDPFLDSITAGIWSDVIEVGDLNQGGCTAI